jgi:hypothetical protein
VGRGKRKKRKNRIEKYPSARGVFFNLDLMSIWYNVGMISISAEHIDRIKELYYEKNMAVPQISAETGFSVDAIYAFMQKFDLKRRTLIEDNKIRFARKAPSFQIRQPLSSEDEKLKMAGIMLYWAEGFKAASAPGIDFANSDPRMIVVFMAFLRTVCGIDETRLRIYLYCYANQKPFELIDFWSKLTGIPAGQFTKPYVRQDFQESKIGKMPHGLIHIRYHDKKLLFLLKDWIEEYSKKCASAGAVNRSTL